MGNKGECAPMGSGREGENPLWRFAIDFYGKAEHEAILLRLQDDYGADVLKILTAIWIGCLGHRVRIDEILDDSEYEVFRESMIVPLRQLRYQIKQNSVGSSTYELAKQLELALEQEGLMRVYQLVEASGIFLKQVVSRSRLETIEQNLLAALPDRSADEPVCGSANPAERSATYVNQAELQRPESLCHSLAVSAAEAGSFPSDG